jgi:O-antigen/teichoic acid export membrane protein
MPGLLFPELLTKFILGHSYVQYSNITSYAILASIGQIILSFWLTSLNILKRKGEYLFLMTLLSSINLCMIFVGAHYNLSTIFMLYAFSNIILAVIISVLLIVKKL